MSGVGISFGFDRICIVLEMLDLFPDFSEIDSSFVCKFWKRRSQIIV